MPSTRSLWQENLQYAMGSIGTLALAAKVCDDVSLLVNIWGVYRRMAPRPSARRLLQAVLVVFKSEEESAEEKWKDGVIPAVARAAIEEELSKLEALEKNSAEFNVTRNYLDWLTGLPWGSVSGEVFDVAAAKEALDDVHYGMDDVRSRRPTRRWRMSSRPCESRVASMA